MSFAKNISKSLKSKYIQTLLGSAKQSAIEQIHLKLLQKEQFKATSDFTGNKVVNKITMNLSQNNLETSTQSEKNH